MTWLGEAVVIYLLGLTIRNRSLGVGRLVWVTAIWSVDLVGDRVWLLVNVTIWCVRIIFACVLSVLVMVSRVLCAILCFSVRLVVTIF